MERVTPAPFSFTELTPTAFLDRSAHAFASRDAIVDEGVRFTYAEFGARSRRLAGALHELGIEPGDRVAALCTNSHVMLECHHGVPYAGAVLVPLNTRLSVDEIVHIVEHSGARLLIVTRELVTQARAVAERTGVELVEEGERYESIVAEAPERVVPVGDERGLLAINYTSGTTGRPKGVMYHHRGANLQALAMAFHLRLEPASRYLWTLPMFHCDGWCFPWAVTAAGALHVCLRAIDAEEIWRLIRTEGVTHYCAAPTVLTMIAHAQAAKEGPAPERVTVATGGAPPSPTLLAQMDELGMSITHLYGLTETYGPAAVNDWQPEWDHLDATEQARLKARQGVGNVIAQRLRVLDEQTGVEVPSDGETMGELVLRGNDVMLGYYRDPEATAEVDARIPGEHADRGWFRTGDLGVVHPDGYVEIRDRSKDVIISGGENIASVEVERVLDSHPAVIESAVVGAPDERWGEVPVAYVAVREEVAPDELIAHVRTHLARFKAPKRIVFGELPKTSTGKIQKNVLRDQG
ncbi:acyl--CoA ligase family protein [Actinomycetospora cinnamomea]|uniref:Fatty-acyl-CoA synthase n=1 Tax=Actinomycetospora cinnamomea TaxID=663609 RepID=A0A2U1FCX7_9PSEU|nr:acyl--CoA ligase family protein [Actinomycetospora cinnamomea]PVZ09989.1 fatty-acyl-CoA synthase [Actinomycetospora cinnamomea]